MIALCADVLRMARGTWKPWLLPWLALGLSGCATRLPSTEFHRAVRAPDAEGHSLRAVPFYTADEEQADAAVWAMATDVWRPPGRWARFRPGWRARRVALAEPDGQLDIFFRERGLWAYGGEGRLDTIRVRLRAEIPVLVLLQDRPVGRAHFSLVAGYDDAREQVLLYGPGAAPRTMAYDAFLTAWGYGGYRYVSVCPPERATWPLTASERVGRGRYYMAEMRYGRAATDFEVALALEPGAALHYVELADAYLLREEYAEAERLYRVALVLDDLNARAMNNLAYALIHADGDLDEARRWARNAAALEPDNPRMLDTLGVALYRAGEYEEAARILERARTRAMRMDGRTRATIALHLVWVYHDDGLWHLARQTLADALTHDPELAVPAELQRHIRSGERMR